MDLVLLVLKKLRCLFGIHEFVLIKHITTAYDKISCVYCSKCFAKARGHNIKIPYTKYHLLIEKLEDEVNELKKTLSDKQSKNHKRYSDNKNDSN